MSVTSTDLIAGLLGRMALGSGASSSIGRAGLAGMVGSGFLQSHSGVGGGAAGLASEMAHLPQTMKEFREAVQLATAALKKGKGGMAGNAEAAGGDTSDLKELFSGKSGAAGGGAATEAESGGAGAAAGELGAGAIGSFAYAAKKIFWDLPKQIEQQGAEQLEEQRKYAQFSGQAAAAYAHLDANRLRRDMQTAAELAPSIANLARAQNDIEDAGRHPKAIIQRWRNDFQAKMDSVGAALFEAADRDLTFVDMLLRGPKAAYGPAPKPGDSPVVHLAREIAQGLHGGRKYAPLPAKLEPRGQGKQWHWQDAHAPPWGG